ncbi:MAG TPA: hypothetical protein VII11_03445, partial [Bacteroidota bacterium]
MSIKRFSSLRCAWLIHCSNGQIIPRKVAISISFILSCLLVSPQHAFSQESFDPAKAWAQLPALLKRISPPVFPDRKFVITDFGAVGDGTTDCT